MIEWGARQTFGRDGVRQLEGALCQTCLCLGEVALIAPLQMGVIIGVEGVGVALPSAQGADFEIEGVGAGCHVAFVLVV